MAEAGVDISRHYSKHVDELLHIPFNRVITVCDSAAEVCPVFPKSIRVIHHGFQDPPALAMSARSEEEALGHYRRIRDEIQHFVKHLPELVGP